MPLRIAISAIFDTTPLLLIIADAIDAIGFHAAIAATPLMPCRHIAISPPRRHDYYAIIFTFRHDTLRFIEAAAFHA
jgi:hypothetical protein